MITGTHNCVIGIKAHSSDKTMLGTVQLAKNLCPDGHTPYMMTYYYYFAKLVQLPYSISSYNSYWLIFPTRSLLLLSF